MLTTERLYLRNFTDDDASALYELAKEPDIGYWAGWPAHQSVEESLRIIQTVFISPTAYAIIERETDHLVGSIELIRHGDSRLTQTENQADIGYWIGKKYWGRGYAPEAIEAVVRYAFEELELDTIWCGYFEGNEQSKRAQLKCGFEAFGVIEEVECRLLGEVRREYVTVLQSKKG